MWRTLHSGSVRTTVFTQSSTDMPPTLMVDRICAVSVAKMLAFTPLPRPSASTQMRVSSLLANITRSPQSCSPRLIRLMYPVSIKISLFMETPLVIVWLPSA